MASTTGSARKIPIFIYARISNDPGNDRAGVELQVRNALAKIGPDSRYELMSFTGSPLEAPRKRRRKRDPETRQLIPLEPLSTACWPDGVLVDDDISSAAHDGVVAERPEYNRGVGFCGSGEAGAIGTRDLNRLWRNVEQFGAFQRETRSGTGTGKHQITVETEDNGHYELWTPTAEMIVGILAITGGFTVNTNIAHQRDLTLDAAEKKAAHGKAPFGYRAMHKEPGGGLHEPVTGSEAGGCWRCEGRRASRLRTLVIEPAEAEALADAARRALEGEPLYSILGVLDDVWQTPTRTGLAWRQAKTSSLTAVLLNPQYTGARAHTPGWTGNGHRPRGEAATDLYEDAWPAILTPGQHDDLVKMLTAEHMACPTCSATPGKWKNKTCKRCRGTGSILRNPNTWAGLAEPRHLLTSLAECGLCHGPLFVQGNRNQPRYTCLSIPGELGHVTRKKLDAEAEVRRVIFWWMADGGLYDQAVRSAESDDVKALKKRLKDAEAKRDRIFDNAVEFELTREQVREKAKPVVDEITTLNEQVKAARTYDALKDVPERGAVFAAAWAGWDLAKQRRITHALISRVVIYPAPKRGGKPADPRFVLPFPAGWARDLKDPTAADPLPPPADIRALESRGIVRAWLTEHTGTLASAAQIAAGTGLPDYTVNGALGKLMAAGEAEREWCAFGVERAVAGPGNARGKGTFGWRLAGTATRAPAMPEPRPCPVDGVMITGAGAYCSPGCRAKAHYRNRTGKPVADQS